MREHDYQDARLQRRHQRLRQRRMLPPLPPLTLDLLYLSLSPLSLPLYLSVSVSISLSLPLSARRWVARGEVT